MLAAHCLQLIRPQQLSSDVELQWAAAAAVLPFVADRAALVAPRAESVKSPNLPLTWQNTLLQVADCDFTISLVHYKLPVAAITDKKIKGSKTSSAGPSSAATKAASAKQAAEAQLVQQQQVSTQEDCYVKHSDWDS